MHKKKMTKHVDDGDDEEAKKRMKELNEKLEEKCSELKEVEIRNTILVIKERRSSEEIEEAREELITGLKDISDDRTTIGVKRLGEIDVKPFLNVCNQRFTGDEVYFQFAMLYSKWQHNINDLSWVPFKVLEDEDSTKEVVDEEDEKLMKLRDEWGEEVENAVKRALEEFNEFNSSDRYSVPTLWNFKQGRKATLKEGITYLLHEIKSLKRKRTE
ncbi:unnamed protein product [Arabidopsis halleri]